MRLDIQLPRLARVWAEFTSDDHHSEGGFLANQNFDENVRKVAIVSLGRYIGGITTVGLQFYTAFLPFTRFLDDHCFYYAFMAGMTFTCGVSEFSSREIVVFTKRPLFCAKVFSWLLGNHWHGCLPPHCD